MLGKKSRLLHETVQAQAHRRKPWGKRDQLAVPVVWQDTLRVEYIFGFDLVQLGRF